MDYDLREKSETYSRVLKELLSSDLLITYRQNNSFKDKNIIVTGGSGGIGSVVVGAYLYLGAHVCAVVKDEKKALEIFGTIF